MQIISSCINLSKIYFHNFISMRERERERDVQWNLSMLESEWTTLISEINEKDICPSCVNMGKNYTAMQNSFILLLNILTSFGPEGMQ